MTMDQRGNFDQPLDIRCGLMPAAKLPPSKRRIQKRDQRKNVFVHGH